MACVALPYPGEPAPPRQDESDTLAGRYVPLSGIAAGNFGRVEKMLDLVTGEHVAVKSTTLASEEGMTSFAIREIAALSSCKHPNVVKMLGVHAVPHSVHIIMELMDMNLRDYMRRVLRGSFGAEAGVAFRQILQGVDCCHRSGYIHRDLKPQNILVDVKTGTLKVSDFGLARRCLPLDIRTGPFTKLVITLWYRPPELMLFERHQSRYGHSVDMWSLGCILAEMCTATPLFPGDSEIDTLFKIFRIKGTPTPQTWPGVERLAHFKSTWPQWQDTHFKQVLEMSGTQHSSRLLAVLEEMLRYVPEQRASAYTLLSHEFFRNPQPPADASSPGTPSTTASTAEEREQPAQTQ